jgi:outer membrane protein
VNHHTFMRTTPVMRHAPLFALLAACCVPRVIAAQAAAPDARVAAPGRPAPAVAFTIEQAVALAARNNPQHLSTIDRRGVAIWQLRSGYGAFLPTVTAEFGSQYREGLQQLIAGQRFGAPSDQISSSYDIGVRAQYNAATLLTPKLQRANLRAADAAVAGSEHRLRTAVTQQYLNVLQQRARAALQDTLLATAQAQLTLANARADAGAVTPLDVRRAEVAVGQQEVALVQAANQVEIEKLRLFQQIGVPRPDSVELTSAFTMTEPALSMHELIALAKRSNPTLEEMRSRAEAAQVGFRNAQAQYTPTLTVATGVGGYTNQYTDQGFVLSQRTQTKQQQCAAGAGDDPSAVDACRNATLTTQETAQALAENRQFPFRFQRNPFSVGATLTIPVFNGFQREQHVQEAAAARNDARYTERAQELQLEADITAAFLNLTAARRTVMLQERTAAAAREAMYFAQERYRVGLNSFVDVVQARGDRERAENDRIAAIYDYHRAFAALEGAVGMPLR